MKNQSPHLWERCKNSSLKGFPVSILIVVRESILVGPKIRISLAVSRKALGYGCLLGEDLQKFDFIVRHGGFRAFVLETVGI